MTNELNKTNALIKIIPNTTTADGHNIMYPIRMPENINK